MSFNQIFNLVNFSGVEFYYFLKRFIKSSFCVYLTARKRENRHFHVVVIQRRQRNVQKSVMHVQSCCSANSKPILLSPFSLPSLSRSPFAYVPRTAKEKEPSGFGEGSPSFSSLALILSTPSSMRFVLFLE